MSWPTLLRSAAAVFVAGALVTRFLTPSPMLLSAFLLLFFAGTLATARQPAGAEQFSPVYTRGVANGLSYGVAAVQGRRAYMEDMHRIVDFADEPAAAGVGMTHFFSVFDGHGGKRAAAWAHTHLVSNLLLELTRSRAEAGGSVGSVGGGSGAGGSSASGVLDGAAVDAFHRTDAAFLRQAAARGIPDGSTAVTCMIQTAAAAGGGGGRSDRRLLVANLGDSRCVMVRARFWPALACGSLCPPPPCVCWPLLACAVPVLPTEPCWPVLQLWVLQASAQL